MKKPPQLPSVLLAFWCALLILPAARATEPASAPSAPSAAAPESERLHRLLDLAWEEKLSS